MISNCPVDNVQMLCPMVIKCPMVYDPMISNSLIMPFSVMIYNYLILVNDSDDTLQKCPCANSLSYVWLVEFELNLWKYCKPQSKCLFFAHVP